MAIKLLILSALFWLTSTCPVVFAEPTSTVRQTSTITIVQTVYTGTETSAAATDTTAASTDGHSYVDDAVFKGTILNVSNTVRQNYNASALVWNTTLAAYAQAWSQGCRFQHSEQNGPYGENLAETYPSASAAVTAWGNESKKFNFADPGFTDSTGHFSQMVWKSTTSIGCGRTKCGDISGNERAVGWYVVCSYWPRGNIVGEFGTNIDAAIDGSGNGWGGGGMIARSKSGTGRITMCTAIVGAQLLALMSIYLT